MTVRRVLARVTALVRGRKLDRELGEEILAHLELAEQDALARGLSPDQARAEARRRFGGIEQMKEEQRDARSVPWMETLVRDFRYGIASLWRAPSFTAVVIGVLAIGIGGTVALFSIVDAVLVKPLPFPDPDRLVQIWEAPRPGVVNATMPAQFLAWKRLNTAFEAMAAERSVSGALNGTSGPVRILGKSVTSEYFKIFGLKTILGRSFTAADDRPGAPPVLVLSYAEWQSDFAGDHDILNHPVRLDGRNYQVIGVLAAGAFDRDDTKFWTPLVFSSVELTSKLHTLLIDGRIRPNATLAQARQQMQSVYSALQSDSSMDEVRGGSIVVERLSRLLVGDNLRQSIVIAFGGVLLVLLIACANVANLLFARGATRKAELAVRAALGAGKGRLISQLLTECLALCSMGGAAGVALAYALVRAARPVLSDLLPFTADVRVDVPVLAFACALILGVGLSTGAFPAFQASFGNLADFLKQGSRTLSVDRTRVRRIVVIGEVALSLILVSGALVLARSLINLQRVETGIHIENIVTGSLSLSSQAYPTAQRAANFYEILSRRLSSTPGVTHVALSTYLPLNWISNGEGIFVPGLEKQILIRCKRVDPGYFETVGMAVLRGRGIQDRDRQGAPGVIVINKTLAERLSQATGIKDPVGKTVRLTSSDYSGQQSIFLAVQIAGVVRSERTASPGSPDPPVVYLPLAQSPNPNVKLLVRSNSNTSSLLTSIRHVLRQVDPSMPLADIASMEQVRDDTLSPVSRPAWLIGGFAVVAALLAGVGLYGLISHLVAQQRREIAIRMALGANSSSVLSQVLGRASRTVVIGIVIGLAGSLMLNGILRSLLFEVSPLDPLSLVLASLSMLLVGAGAGVSPANRAARVDPAFVLRDSG